MALFVLLIIVLVVAFVVLGVTTGSRVSPPSTEDPPVDSPKAELCEADSDSHSARVVGDISRDPDSPKLDSAIQESSAEASAVLGSCSADGDDLAAFVTREAIEDARASIERLALEASERLYSSYAELAADVRNHTIERTSAGVRMLLTAVADESSCVLHLSMSRQGSLLPPQASFLCALVCDQLSLCLPEDVKRNESGKWHLEWRVSHRFCEAGLAGDAGKRESRVLRDAAELLDMAEEILSHEGWLG